MNTANTTRILHLQNQLTKRLCPSTRRALKIELRILTSTPKQLTRALSQPNLDPSIRAFIERHLAA